MTVKMKIGDVRHSNVKQYDWEEQQNQKLVLWKDWQYTKTSDKTDQVRSLTTE